MKGKKKKHSMALFMAELLIIVVVGLGIFIYAKVNENLRARNSASENQTSTAAANEADANANGDAAAENSGVDDDSKMTGYTNLVLVGIDTREGNLHYANSDTMIICSINNDTKQVRLVSLYRDTLLNIGSLDDENAVNFDKCNAAYAVGSAKQMLQMMNKNLDMNLHDYVVVDFSAVAKLAEDLGGIDVDLTYEEAVHLNDYCVETAQVTGDTYTPLDIPDEANQWTGTKTFHLNGVQTVAYARIRYTAGNDFKRTQRQRLVIEKLVEKAKSAGFSSVSSIIADVFPLCYTSYSSSDILKLATQVFDYNIDKTSGFPFEHLENDVTVGDNTYDCVVPVTLEQNVKELHAFLFDDENYEPTETVKEYSQNLIDLSGYGEDSIETATKNSVISGSGGEADSVK